MWHYSPDWQGQSWHLGKARWWFLSSSPQTRASQVVLVVKNTPGSVGDIRDVGSIPGSGRFPGGRKAWQLTLVFLPGDSHRQSEPGGLPSIGSQRVRHIWAANFTTESASELRNPVGFSILASRMLVGAGHSALTRLPFQWWFGETQDLTL